MCGERPEDDGIFLPGVFSASAVSNPEVAKVDTDAILRLEPAPRGIKVTKIVQRAQNQSFPAVAANWEGTFSAMTTMTTFLRRASVLGVSAFLLLASPSLHAQTCLTASDMDPATKTALLNTAQKYFDNIAHGDSAALRQDSIASVSADFSGIESAIKDNQSALSSGKAIARPPFLLQAEGKAPLERAEFLCGIFGSNGQTADSRVFVIPNLPPGNYGFVTEDVSAAKGPYTVSYVLEQEGTAWKLGGLYIKPAQVGGHDGNWFAARARELKSKGQNHAAWFDYQEARDLLVPVTFMSTMLTDKLYDESQGVKPSDLPPTDLTADGKTYKLTALFPLAVDNELYLVAKYATASVANSASTYQDNLAVMKGILTKYPELRANFDGVIARGVEPSGRDYGTMLHMKDIK
jgi:hypothetical protein